MQDQKATDLRIGKLGIEGKIRVGLIHAILNQVIHLGFSSQIVIARVRKIATLSPVTTGLKVNVYKTADFGFALTKSNRFFDKGEKLQFIFNVLRCKHGAIGQLSDVFGPIDNAKVAFLIKVACITRVVPTFGVSNFGGGLRIFIVFAQQAWAANHNLTIISNAHLNTWHGLSYRIGANMAIGLNANPHCCFG